MTWLLAVAIVYSGSPSWLGSDKSVELARLPSRDACIAELSSRVAMRRVEGRVLYANTHVVVVEMDVPSEHPLGDKPIPKWQKVVAVSDYSCRRVLP